MPSAGIPSGHSESFLSGHINYPSLPGLKLLLQKYRKVNLPYKADPL
jgi:hypothetical protein